VSVRFARTDGRDLGWRIERWVGHAEPVELDVLKRTAPPVLDIGCGPGRHVIALARMGVMALGVDIAPTAVAIAHARGVPVLQRSIFERVPGAGRWGSALLLDGNIGIGGEPEILLTRVRALLRPVGRILVEVDTPGTPTERISVRLDGADGGTPSFPWATLGAGDLKVVAGRSGLTVTRLWCANDRWFGCLVC
jgi:SAM-dependent methyltransferase